MARWPRPKLELSARPDRRVDLDRDPGVHDHAGEWAERQAAWRPHRDGARQILDNANYRAQHHPEQGLTTSQLNALSANALDAIELPELSSTQLKGLTTTSIGSLTETQVATLTSTEVSLLSPAQIGALTSTELQAFTTTQANALTSTQLRRPHHHGLGNSSTTQMVR